MKNWEEDDTEEHCSASEDIADAQAVCDKLDIPLHRINFAAEYWDEVFEHFLKEYEQGRTPNPDILCNKEIKFKACLQYAKHLGAHKLATGHYARIQANEQGYQLLKGLDANKDQSYFLYALDQQQLAQAWFPIGDLPKEQVRSIAQQAGLINHSKKDSTGICFIGERPFKTFLQTYLPAQPGDIETPAGDKIGRHDGIVYYTIGQRQGLGLGGLKDYPEAPWFVVDKDVQRNVLVVAQGTEHPLLYKSQLGATQLHWIWGEAPSEALTCQAKIRYRQPQQACELKPYDEQTWQVTFTTPQRAVTPGQAIVFYQGEVCLGGAIIS
jgi:tRNA-specific 2-thiouridylase